MVEQEQEMTSRRGALLKAIAPNKSEAQSPFYGENQRSWNKSIILFQNEHFVVINKPYDVRMNGDFDTTVEHILMDLIEESSPASLKWIHQLGRRRLSW